MVVYIEAIYILLWVIIMTSMQCSIVLLQCVISTKKLVYSCFLLSLAILSLYNDIVGNWFILYWFMVFGYLFKKQVFLYFPVYLVVYFSIIYFIQSLSNMAYVYKGILLVEELVSLVICIVMGGIFCILLILYIMYSKKRIGQHGLLYSMVVYYQDRAIDCIGFLDTGNELYYEGYPLFLIHVDKIGEYVCIDNITVSGIKEYQLPIIQVNKICINQQVVENVYLAVVDNIHYDCLLHKQLMGGVMGCFDGYKK